MPIQTRGRFTPQGRVVSEGRCRSAHLPGAMGPAVPQKVGPIHHRKAAPMAEGEGIEADHDMGQTGGGIIVLVQPGEEGPGIPLPGHLDLWSPAFVDNFPVGHGPVRGMEAGVQAGGMGLQIGILLHEEQVMVGPHPDVLDGFEIVVAAGDPIVGKEDSAIGPVHQTVAHGAVHDGLLVPGVPAQARAGGVQHVPAAILAVEKGIAEGTARLARGPHAGGAVGFEDGVVGILHPVFQIRGPGQTGALDHAFTDTGVEHGPVPHGLVADHIRGPDGLGVPPVRTGGQVRPSPGIPNPSDPHPAIDFQY